MTNGLDQPPWIAVDRLLIVATGSASAAFLPYWINLLRVTHPRLQCRAVVTANGERFVTRAALTAASGTKAIPDAWPEPDDATAVHVELCHWAEAMVVYPASFHFLARLALGLADTPALLAAQCTTAPIAVAPSVPPGATSSPTYLAHVAALRDRRNVVVADPVPGRSIATDRQEAWTPAPLPQVLELLEACRQRLLESVAPPGSRNHAVARP
ncbi:MAG: flavoprotein [Egibacteraceae bacterium]